ncbi:g5385 [Coccomyxa elongata]
MLHRRGVRVDYRRLTGDEDSASPEAPPAVAAPAAAPRPAAAAKPAKRQLARKTTKKKPKKKRRRETYSGYIYKILKDINPDKGISQKAMQVMDDLVRDLFTRIAAAAKTAMDSTGQATMTTRDIQTGVKLVLGNTELEKHALSTAHKAVSRFVTA